MIFIKIKIDDMLKSQLIYSTKSSKINRKNYISYALTYVPSSIFPEPGEDYNL